MTLFAAILLGCARQDFQDEDLLWTYYSGFTYPPSLFDSLESKAQSQETRLFLEGLRCFEKFSQFDNQECYDSARNYFQALRAQAADSYLGYLGMGLLLTENAMGSDPSAAGMFADAAAYYDSALKRKPGHAAVYYYSARNLYNSDKAVFNRRAITMLDTATLIRPAFAKALERQAEYLSHYLDLEATGKVDSVRFYFPNIESQIKHYFAASLQYDSSWFQTYAGIARSYRVYSTRERIDFLKKGLAIARIQKSPELGRLANSLADIYFYELADYETTIDARESISETEGSYADERRNYPNLGWAHFYRNSPEQAAIFMTRNTESTSGREAGEAWLHKAQLHLLQFQYADALEAAEKAIAADPRNPLRAMILKARVYVEAGSPERATVVLQQARSFAERTFGDAGNQQQEYEKIIAFLEVLE